MEQITLGQIAAALIFVTALIAGIQNLKKSMKDWMDTALKARFDAIDKQIEEIIVQHRQKILCRLKFKIQFRPAVKSLLSLIQGIVYALNTCVFRKSIILVFCYKHHLILQIC